MKTGELILYTAEDGQSRLEVRLVNQTVWLSLAQMAELFQRDKSGISRHIKNIFEEGELSPEGVVADFATTAADGKNYQVAYYNLDVILAVGYRVKSDRGTRFRVWATQRLKEYIVKGFVMDDERLKNPGGWDYFDELLQRIRDIRASEKRFYQKVRDIYATAVDYDKKSDAAQLFFKKVQNKMFWAVTGHTAPELIAGRSDSHAPNMGLTSWQGAKVRKHDVTIAKNYLSPEEIEVLNRIVVMYLDYAEDMAHRRKVMTMHEWEEKLDAFLSFNEREVLTHAGKMRTEVADRLAHKRYEAFDVARRESERLKADLDEVAVLEKMERKLEGKGRGKKNSGPNYE